MSQEGEHNDDKNQPITDHAMRQRYKLQFDDPQWLPSATEYVTIEEARRIVSGAMKKYIDTDYGEDTVLVIAAGTGVGKTTTALQVLNDYGHRTIFCMAHKRHFSTISNNKNFVPENWTQWIASGDESLTIPDQKMCKEHHRAQKTLTARVGLNAACKLLCQNYKQDCEYQRQKLIKQPFIATSHNYLSQPFGLYGEQPQVVIVDEDPTSSFIDRVRLNSRHIPTDGDPRTIPFLKELIVCCSSSIQLSGRALMERLRPYADDWMQAVKEGHLPKTAEPKNEKELNSLKTDIWEQFQSIFERELKAYDESSERYAERIVCGSTEKGSRMILKSRKYVSPVLNGVKIIILDGTADYNHYKSLFPDRKVIFVEPKVKQLGKLYQVIGNQYGTTVMDDSGEAPNRYIDKVLRQMQLLARTKGYKEIGIVSFKKLEDLLGGFAGIDNFLSYGSGATGSNALENCDAVFVVGTFQPPPTAIMDTHLCINQTDMRHLTTEVVEGFFLPQYTTKMAHYDYWDKDGKQACRMVGGFWQDPLYTIFLWSSRRHLIQAIGRARLNIKASVVWLFSPLPTGLPLDGIYDHAPVYPDGIDRDRWAKIQEGLSRCGRGDIVTCSDVAEWAGVSPRYASGQKWIEKIAAYLDVHVATAGVSKVRQKALLYMGKDGSDVRFV